MKEIIDIVFLILITPLLIFTGAVVYYMAIQVFIDLIKGRGMFDR